MYSFVHLAYCTRSDYYNLHSVSKCFNRLCTVEVIHRISIRTKYDKINISAISLQVLIS